MCSNWLSNGIVYLTDDRARRRVCERYSDGEFVEVRVGEGRENGDNYWIVNVEKVVK